MTAVKANFLQNRSGTEKAVRQMIEDLVRTLNVSNVNWSDYEESFICSMEQKLGFPEIRLTAMQYSFLHTLWARV